MSRRFLIITLSLTLIALVFQGLLSGAPGFLTGVLELVLFSSIASVLFFLVSFGRTPWRRSFARAFLIIGAMTGVIILLATLFVSLANLFPGKLARITLENGSGNMVVFYQMSHIATESYYSQIEGDLDTLSGSDTLLYVEGVRSGSEKSQDILDRTLGIRIHSGTYEQIADMVDMRSQDETLYRGVPRTALRYPDVSIDELVEIIGTGSIRTDTPVDITALSLDGVTRIGRYMVGEAMRAVMNISIKTTTSSDLFMEAMSPQVREAILEARNESLVMAYKKDTPARAVFLYGALHFDGVYSLLRQGDPSWQIREILPLYPYVR